MNEMSGFFPLRSLADLRALVEAELKRNKPDLVLLSVVIGALEHQWTNTANKANLEVESPDKDAEDENDDNVNNPSEVKIEPQLEYHVIEALIGKFEGIIKGYCDVNLLKEAKESHGEESKMRPLIKHVADIVWNTLSKSHYKDRPHLQSIYSYLTGNKLDCFGVAFTVVAACQMLLQNEDVSLALSEDHAWVVFGPEGTATAEVTWHGKGNEDKRGQSVEIEKAKTAWLYVAGQPVVCDPGMAVAAIVSSINPALTANLDSVECGVMQQELLWLLYDKGHLKAYPMALGNLADLEEISPSLGRPPCGTLFNEAIEVNRTVYKNHHVYPYTYSAGFFYRKKNYKAAFEGWANAADAIRRFVIL